MPEGVQILRVVVASPSDVSAEREIVPRVAEELNRSIAADRGLRLEIIKWETDTYPGFHAGGPQELIDELLRIEDCDLLLGIFWKRFGTPVSDAESGTEHEIRQAYEGWKKNGRPQVMVYFSQKRYLPQSKEETDQWGQVLEFRRLFPKEGLWFPYKGPAAFEALLRRHLTNFLRSRYPIGDAASSATKAASPAPPLVPGYFTVQRKLIEEYTRQFAGRLEAQVALDGFFAKHTKGYFLVRSGPGQGKTALSCQLVKGGGYIHHFIDRTGGRADARLILRSLLSQVFALDGKTANLPESVAELTKMFEEVLADAALRRKTLTIVIDGLDELPPGEQPPYLTTEALPDHVFFVVTSRPGEQLERLSQQLFAIPSQTYELGALLPGEMRLILTQAVPGMTPADMDRIVEASQGNPLYLRAVVKELARNPRFNLMDLPVGIEGFFRESTASLRVGNAVLSNVLGLLSTSRKPLSVAEMSRITGKPQRDIVEQGINPVRQFLLEIDGSFTFYHARFHEFVTRTILYEDETRECHGRIAGWLQEPDQRFSDDSLNSLAWHLFESGNREDLIRIIDEKFLVAKVGRLGYAVLEDVELLTRCLLAKGDAGLIGRCVELVEVLRQAVGGDIIPAIGSAVQPYRSGPPSFRARLIEPRVASMPGADVYVGVLPKAEMPADFFEVVRVQNRLAVAIGDVPALGLKSTFVARFIANLFRKFAGESGRHRQGEILQRIDATIRDHDYFQSVTMQCVEMDPGDGKAGEGRLRMANAGHPFPVYYSARRGKCDVLPISGSLLHGPAAEAERDEYVLETGAGDALVLLTDGLTESHVLSEDSYGYRFMQIIEQRAAEGARAIGQAILDGWRAHPRADDAGDDVTVMVISLLPLSDLGKGSL